MANDGKRHQYRRDEAEKLIEDDTDMVLKYRFVNPVTMTGIDPVVREVTANMIGKWISTRLHPDFL